MQRRVFSYSGTITNSTGDVTQNFDAIDLSWADQLYITLELTDAAGSDGSDTLTAYLQNRWYDGVWNDRAALSTITGLMAAGEFRDATINKFGDFSDSEEAGEPSGSTGASHLTPPAVRNGAFPPLYKNVGVGKEYSWRILLDITNVGAASFPIEINVYADAAG